MPKPKLDPSAFDDFLAIASHEARSADSDNPSLAPMILVVEDNADISTALQLRLKMHGFRVCQAFDAVLAMDVAMQNLPDLAILDISMPGGSGFDVAKRLRAEPDTAHVPVIFLTASLRPGLSDEAARVGAAAFLTKPFESSELIDEIRRLLPGAYDLD